MKRGSDRDDSGVVAGRPCRSGCGIGNGCADAVERVDAIKNPARGPGGRYDYSYLFLEQYFFRKFNSVYMI